LCKWVALAKNEAEQWNQEISNFFVKSWEEEEEDDPGDTADGE